MISARMMEQIAFNLCSLHDFDPAFVASQKRFAEAVMAEYDRARTSEPEAGAVVESDAAMAERFYVQAWMKAGKSPPLAWADLPAEQRAAKIEALGDFRSAVGLGVYHPAPATADKLRAVVEGFVSDLTGGHPNARRTRLVISHDALSARIDQALAALNEGGE